MAQQKADRFSEMDKQPAGGNQPNQVPAGTKPGSAPAGTSSASAGQIGSPALTPASDGVSVAPPWEIVLNEAYDEMPSTGKSLLGKEDHRSKPVREIIAIRRKHAEKILIAAFQMGRFDLVEDSLDKLITNKMNAAATPEEVDEVEGKGRNLMDGAMRAKQLVRRKIEAQKARDTAKIYMTRNRIRRR